MAASCPFMSRAPRVPIFSIFHHSLRSFAAPKFHKFESIVREREIASIPADDPVVGLIEELKEYVHEFHANEDMDEFFTRKSHQNMLSVVQTYHEEQYHYYRGRNIEVSLPAGSLCAERSAIGNATSNNLHLHRKDFKRIAVIDPSGENVGREPCGVCKEYLRKFQEESPEFCIVTFPDKEFRAIYEHFPATYPVEDVDVEMTQKLLEQVWTCNSCDFTNSGYSTQCVLCGVKKNVTTKKHYGDTIFSDASLTIKLIDGIYEHYYPETEFTIKELKSAVSLNNEKERMYCSGIVGHLASKRRGILTRSEINSKGNRLKHEKFQTNQLAFDQYRKSLKDALPHNGSPTIVHEANV